MLGVDKLVILGGNTIEDGYDSKTGSPFDDICVSLLFCFSPLLGSLFTDRVAELRPSLRPIQSYNIGVIDIFDVSRRHWSRIRPPASIDTKPVFFSECTFAPVPPDLKSPLSGWKIISLGKALDLDDLFLTVVSSDDEQSSGADASFDSSSMDLTSLQDPTPSSTSSMSLAPLALPPPPPIAPFPLPTTSVLPQYGVRVAPPSPPNLPPVASILHPVNQDPNENRSMSGGFISLYKRNESLVTASACARVEPKSDGSGSGSGGIEADISEDGDYLGSTLLSFSVPSKLTTCIVVFS